MLCAASFAGSLLSAAQSFPNLTTTQASGTSTTLTSAQTTGNVTSLSQALTMSLTSTSSDSDNDFLEMCRTSTLLAELEDDDELPEPDDEMDDNEDDLKDDEEYDDVMVCVHCCVQLLITVYLSWSTLSIAVLLPLPKWHGYHTTTVLWPFFQDHSGEPVPEENFLTLWCKGRLTVGDTPTIRLGTTLSRLTSAHLHHPLFFTGWMPFLPPNQQSKH